MNTILKRTDDAPAWDRSQLTIRERHVFDALVEKSISEDGWDFSNLSYEQKTELRALLRKGDGELELVSPWRPEDRRDVNILTAINTVTSPFERSDLRQ